MIGFIADGLLLMLGVGGILFLFAYIMDNCGF